MQPKTARFAEDLVVVGIAVRTSPERAMTDIPAAWQRFQSERVAERVTALPDDGGTYAVYCDYETDASGPYTMVLGVRVDGTTAVPAGLRRVRLPAGEYAEFAAKGNPAEVIWKTWVHVNTSWPGRTRRRYIADYERYPSEAPEASTPDSVTAVIGVGVGAA